LRGGELYYPRPRGVSADDSGDQLNDQIDDCIHGASLSLPRGGPCPPPLGHFRCAGAPRRRSALCITALERPWSVRAQRIGSGV